MTHMPVAIGENGPEQSFRKGHSDSNPYVLAANAEGQEALIGTLEFIGATHEPYPLSAQGSEMSLRATDPRPMSIGLGWRDSYPDTLDSAKNFISGELDNSLMERISNTGNFLDYDYLWRQEREGVDTSLFSGAAPLELENDLQAQTQDAIKGRFGYIPYEVYKNFRRDGNSPFDPAGEALCSILGVDKTKYALAFPEFATGGYESDAAKAQPLSPEDADQLLEVMPFMIESGMIDLSRRNEAGNTGVNITALSNSAFLLGLVVEQYPEKVNQVDIKDIIKILKLLIVSAETDVHHPEVKTDIRDISKDSLPHYQQCLDMFIEIRAEQLKQKTSD